MPGIAVVTDSTADFAGADPAELGITVVPLTVNWGRDVLRDGIDLTTTEFYQRLRVDRVLPKTAAPPVGIFEEVYRNLLTTHDAIISVHIASKFSATWSVAVSAAQEVDAGRVHVVDSTTTSIGLGWLAESASQQGAAGHPPEEISQAIRDMIPRVRLYVTLETLEYLHRGGRIGPAQAFLGGLLNIKPVLEVRDGEVHPVERVRTRGASIRRVAELALSLGPKERIAVVHGDCEEEAKALSAELARQAGPSSVPVAQLGPVLATYAGPGVIGVGAIVAS